MEKQWTYTQVFTQKTSFELEKPSWGRKLQNFIQNGFTVNRIHNNMLVSVFEMQLQILTCSDLSPIAVCRLSLLQGISHTPSVMLLLLSEQRFSLALGWMCYSPSVLFELCSVISH